MCSLAVVSREWWRRVVLIDIFELKRIDQRLQTISHGLGRIGIDDEYGTHFGVSGVEAVTILAH
jgi:hypothetical protein|tara:strand:+ start:20660 stop:20851 length:192 start_codon:yes stop_codon:yes gene_type:complete